MSAQEKTDLDVLKRVTAFAVPAYWVRPRLGELKSAGLSPKFVNAEADGLKIEVGLFKVARGRDIADLALEFFLATHFKPLETEGLVCQWRDRVFAMFVPGPAQLEVLDDPKKEQEEPLIQAAVERYRPLMERFSAITGLRVVFHNDRDHEFLRDPLPDEEGVLHIFPNCAPPGDNRSRYVGLVFGLWISDDGSSKLCMGPAKGRGTVKSDKYTPLVQVLGSNAYFLIPTLSTYYGKPSGNIFYELLGLAWQGYLEERAKKPPKPATRKVFLEAGGRWLRAHPDHIRRELGDVNKRIAELQDELATLYLQKSEWEALSRLYEQERFFKERVERLPKDWSLITREPDVESVSVVEDGLHVSTRSIEIEYDGKRYDLGKFTIRLGGYAKAAVWCESPTHPERVPHPHIAKDGKPCFGNASNAILMAAGEHRYADAVHLILRWLKGGYTPALAAVKIEEWPEIAPIEDLKPLEAREVSRG